jgi:hypothetical protein
VAARLDHLDHRIKEQVKLLLEQVRLLLKRTQPFLMKAQREVRALHRKLDGRFHRLPTVAQAAAKVAA